ncbi:MAG: hypothetical protein IT244_01465 [Bacteroidia bacterium]|nr:hypothetical protein [Bacteroidia bacterium]
MQNAKSKYPLFLLIAGSLLAFSWAQRPKFSKKLLYGTWQYTAIVKNGLERRDFGTADTMMLNTKEFHYAIAVLKKEAHGYYVVQKTSKDSSPVQRALEFHYQPIREAKNLIRTFYIMHLSDSLVIREGNTLFCYKKKSP